MCDPNQEVIPTTATKVLSDGSIISRGLEDMFPLLDENTIKLEMIEE